VVLRGGPGPGALARALRAGPVPVIARTLDDALLLDARTLLPGDEALVEAALGALGPRAENAASARV
jgi:hypothetical protein